jgi:hypothetical protein
VRARIFPLNTSKSETETDTISKKVRLFIQHFSYSTKEIPYTVRKNKLVCTVPEQRVPELNFLMSLITYFFKQQTDGIRFPGM